MADGIDPLVSQQPNPGQLPPAAQDMVRSLFGGVGNIAGHIASLPQRMFESSENMRMGGDYNPAPVVETLGMLAGGGASAARALGTEGSLAALGLRPMRDPVPGVIDIETLRSGGNDKLFDIVNELGKRVGWTAITPRPVQKNLYVNEIQGAKGPLSFGTADTRSLIDALKQEFPWAESVSGYRTSGARAKANNRSQARMQIRPDTTSPAQKELREMIGDY